MPAQRETLRRILGWLLAPLPLFLPLFWLDHTRFIGGSDQLFYAHFYGFVADALKSGESFPRWFAEANGGFGSPVAIYYPHLAYLVTALINLPFLPLHLGLGAQLTIGVYASQVVSGFTSFLWLKRRFGERVAFCGSLVYVLLPFKLIYIYLNLNLAQLWALAVLPLWMLAAEEVLTGKRRSIALYALAFAATYYMHPLTVIVFAAVPATYVLWFARAQPGGAILRLLCAHALAMGLCLMQAAPQAAYSDWIHAAQFLSGGFNWRNNFFHIDAMLCAYYLVVALLTATAAHALPKLGESRQGAEAGFWALVIASAAFMTQSPSMFIWEHITPLQYLQFPAIRFHAAALIAVTYLLCVWRAHEEEMLSLGPLVYGRVMMLVLIAGFGAFTYMRVQNVYDGGGAWDVKAARELRLLPTPEYTTRWGCRDFFDALKDYYAGVKAPLAKTEGGKATLTVEDWHPPQRIALKAEVKSKSAVVALRQCYVPQWKVTADGVPLPVLFDASGLLHFTLPKGGHRVEVTFTRTHMERYAAGESALALLLAVLLLVWERKRAA